MVADLDGGYVKAFTEKEEQQMELRIFVVWAFLYTACDAELVFIALMMILVWSILNLAYWVIEINEYIFLSHRLAHMPRSNNRYPYL